jgi:hypothetical protein
MIDGGALTVTLRRSDNGLALRVDAPEPLSLTRLMTGRAPEDAARLAGAVFAAAPSAQEGAARAALGLPVDAALARRIAVEALRDHALRMAVGWPTAIDAEPDVGAMAAAGRVEEDGGAALSLALFGAGGPPRRLADFERWALSGETAPARVLGHLWRRWDCRWCRAAPPLWKPDARETIDWEAAEIGGRAVETGVVARLAATDLLREIEARRGRGLIWRLAARVADADRLLAALAAGDDALPRPEPLAPGVGFCDSARGAMLVRGVAVGGRVVAFARLSPTDCALHPRGALSLMLASLPRSACAPLRSVAALALEAVDPCLPARLVMDDAA